MSSGVLLSVGARSSKYAMLFAVELGWAVVSRGGALGFFACRGDAITAGAAQRATSMEKAGEDKLAMVAGGVGCRAIAGAVE